MEKKTSEIVRGVGVFVEIITELDKLVRAKGGINEDWHRLVKPEGGHILDRIATLIVQGRPDNVYSVEIQQTTLEELISFGHYDWVGDDIKAKYFPLDDSQFGRHDLILVHLNRDANSGVVLRHLDEQGLVPAKIGHLLGFGVKYPDVQLQFPVIALGSSWSSGSVGQLVPYLGSGYGGSRWLHFSFMKLIWRDDSRFLALRKQGV